MDCDYTSMKIDKLGVMYLVVGLVQISLSLFVMLISSMSANVLQSPDMFYGALMGGSGLVFCYMATKRQPAIAPLTSKT